MRSVLRSDQQRHRLPAVAWANRLSAMAAPGTATRTWPIKRHGAFGTSVAPCLGQRHRFALHKRVAGPSPPDSVWAAKDMRLHCGPCLVVALWQQSRMVVFHAGTWKAIFAAIHRHPSPLQGRAPTAKFGIHLKGGAIEILVRPAW